MNAGNGGWLVLYTFSASILTKHAARPKLMPMNTQKPFSYFRLFGIMFMLSACTFGGGYVIVSLMRKKFVDELGWIDGEELLDLTAIAQATPGPLVVNVAVLVGHRLGGVRGFLCCLLGTVLPPLILLSIIAQAYAAFRDNPVILAALRTMRAAIAAVLADVVLDMGAKVVRGRDALDICLMVAAFLITYCLPVNVAFVLMGCGIIGAVRTLLSGRGEGDA